MNKAIVVLVTLVLLALAIPVSAEEEAREPIRPVLIVMDVQNKYIPMMDEREQEPAMRMINGVIWQFRQFEMPVVRVYHTDPKWGPAPGSEDFEFPETVIIKDDDPKIVKNFPSAFHDTELDALLEEMEVNTVFISGLSATGCALATYFGALERGYNVFMVEGAILSHDAEKTEVIKDILDSVTWGGLELILRGASH
jgi:nicotinamidase-related amidase